jgi:hypothetical protein
MKKILKFTFFLVFCCVTFHFLDSCNGGYTEKEKNRFLTDTIQYENYMIPEQKAIEIANKKMIELGYDIKPMRVIAAIRNKPWNYSIVKESTTEYSKTRKELLSNRIYWEIYYSMKKKFMKYYLGGDASIYIDVESGEIITYFLGK